MVLLTDIGWHLCWTVLVTELPVLSSKLGNSGGFRIIRCSAKSNEKGKARMEPYGWAPLHTSTALVICILPQSLWASDCFLYFQWPYVTWSSLHRSWIHICQLPRRFLLYHVASHGKAGWRKWCREFWLRAEHVTEWVLLWRSDSGLRGLHGLPPSLCFWKTIVR